MRRAINILQEWSIPLIAGVFVALIFANVAPQAYELLVHDPITHWDRSFSDEAAYLDMAPDIDHDHEHGPAAAANLEAQAAEHAAEAHAPGHHTTKWWEHYITLHFLINDVFMVFFFGVATKEIVESILPGGALNPPSKAVNPLLGTIGGVLGPIGVYLLLNFLMGHPDYYHGWGIPTATDIALAWLIARMVFGPGHPAISFLLLLAVADDAIGLGIIAFGYPDPQNPTEWLQALWILPGMAFCFGLRKFGVRSWLPYIFIGGALSWWGLFSAHLHPALALVPIVPFLPGAPRDLGMFEEDPNWDAAEEAGHHHSTLEAFEHHLKLPVDFGLFFFAFANAGVGFETINELSLIVFLSLLLGKVVGITGFSFAGQLLGFKLPEGMQLKHLFVASVVAGTGLTVALFVAGQAFANGTMEQDAAKMGALFSGGIFFIAIILGKLLKVKGTGTVKVVPRLAPAH